MAQPLQKFTWDGDKTEAAVTEFLREESVGGGVWFALGCLGTVTIFQFATISGIPDAHLGMSPMPTLWKGGKVARFSAAQLVREQNRGINGNG